MSEELLQGASVFAQPAARRLIVGTLLRDKPPELRRMIEPSQVHQLVNEHVIAHPGGHVDQAPVQADVSRWGARTPTPSLIANADPPDGETERRRQFEKPGRQLPLRASDRLLANGFGDYPYRAAIGFQFAALLFYPVV